jgi:very-short-patch-repair endonuclease
MDAAEADQERTAFFEQEGYRVLRFWNNDVLLNIDGVAGEILKWLGSETG